MRCLCRTGNASVANNLLTSSSQVSFKSNGITQITMSDGQILELQSSNLNRKVDVMTCPPSGGSLTLKVGSLASIMRPVSEKRNTVVNQSGITPPSLDIAKLDKFIAVDSRIVNEVEQKLIYMKKGKTVIESFDLFLVDSDVSVEGLSIVDGSSPLSSLSSPDVNKNCESNKSPMNFSPFLSISSPQTQLSGMFSPGPLSSMKGSNESSFSWNNRKNSPSPILSPPVANGNGTPLLIIKEDDEDKEKLDVSRPMEIDMDDFLPPDTELDVSNVSVSASHITTTIVDQNNTNKEATAMTISNDDDKKENDIVLNDQEEVTMDPEIVEKKRLLQEAVDSAQLEYNKVFNSKAMNALLQQRKNTKLQNLKTVLEKAQQALAEFIV